MDASACPQGCHLCSLEGKALPRHRHLHWEWLQAICLFGWTNTTLPIALREGLMLSAHTPLGPTLCLCSAAASSQLENSARRCLWCWMLKGRHGLAEARTACESIWEEPAEVTLSQQRRALSSWMSELPKCSTNLEHYWNKNSICKNFNQCKIIQAPNPSPPQHAMSSTLSQKNRRAQCARDRILHN